MQKPFKPTPEQIQAAWGKTVPDVIAPDLKILFCGINPSLYTGAVGHHFARPGNRFWPSLHKAEITPRLFSPFEEEELLPLGFGITNLVARATAAASDLKREEFQAAAVDLEEKTTRFRPSVVAFLGVEAYRLAFCRPKAKIGRQEETLAASTIWLLPNPSGLNAHYQIDDIALMLREVNQYAQRR
ncbi:MAG: G/U mismatch-specific DNA glycosylase [Chitinispirillaceae bacterium]